MSKKRKNKKNSKPPPQEPRQIDTISAEGFIEDEVDSRFTKMKSAGKGVYTICKNGERNGTLCHIENEANWCVGKLIGVIPESGLYRVRKTGKKIILSPVKGR